MELSALDQALHALWEELHSLGIPVSKKLAPHVRVNTRAKRRLGCCYFISGELAHSVRL